MPAAKLQVGSSRSVSALQVLQPEQRVVFLDTDSLGAAGRELQQGDAISSPTEAKLAGQVVDAMVAAGLSEQQIGVLSPYRAQVSMSRVCLHQGRFGRARGGPMDHCRPTQTLF